MLSNNIKSVQKFEVSRPLHECWSGKFLSWKKSKCISMRKSINAIGMRWERQMKIFFKCVYVWINRRAVRSISKAEPNANAQQINYQLMFDLSAIYLLDGSIDLWRIAWNTKRIRECTMFPCCRRRRCCIFIHFYFNLFDLSPNNELYVICQFNTYNFSLFPFSILTVVF